MNWAQWVVIVFMVIGFLETVKHDFEGRPAKAAEGFFAFVGTCFGYGVVAWVYWMAGLFTPHN